MLNQRYLPAGSKVLVVRPNGRRVWHTTKTKILFHTEPEPAVCPATGRTDVVTYRAEGMVIFFLPSLIETGTAAVAPDTAPIPEPLAPADLRACLLIYDIPERVEFPNPSDRLRRLGVRVNLSCWCVPEIDVPYTLLHEMTKAGATWHVVRFDANEAPKLVRMCLGAIRKEIADAVVRSKQAAARATVQMDDSDNTPEKVEERYLIRARAIAERYTELVTDLTAAARRFGISEAALQTQDADSAIAGISAGMHARARIYLTKVRLVKQQTGAVFVENCPAGMLADFMDDHGMAADASELRRAFADVAGSWVYGEQPEAPEPQSPEPSAPGHVGNPDREAFVAPETDEEIFSLAGDGA